MTLSKHSQRWESFDACANMDSKNSKLNKKTKIIFKLFQFVKLMRGSLWEWKNYYKFPSLKFFFFKLNELFRWNYCSGLTNAKPIYSYFKSIQKSNLRVLTRLCIIQNASGMQGFYLPKWSFKSSFEILNVNNLNFNRLLYTVSISNRRIPFM